MASWTQLSETLRRLRDRHPFLWVSSAFRCLEPRHAALAELREAARRKSFPALLRRFQKGEVQEPGVSKQRMSFDERFLSRRTAVAALCSEEAAACCVYFRRHHPLCQGALKEEASQNALLQLLFHGGVDCEDGLQSEKEDEGFARLRLFLLQLGGTRFCAVALRLPVSLQLLLNSRGEDFEVLSSVKLQSLQKELSLATRPPSPLEPLSLVSQPDSDRQRRLLRWIIKTGAFSFNTEANSVRQGGDFATSGPLPEGFDTSALEVYVQLSPESEEECGNGGIEKRLERSVVAVARGRLCGVLRKTCFPENFQTRRGNQQSASSEVASPLSSVGSDEGDSRWSAVVRLASPSALREEGCGGAGAGGVCADTRKEVLVDASRVWRVAAPLSADCWKAPTRRAAEGLEGLEVSETFDVSPVGSVVGVADPREFVESARRFTLAAVEFRQLEVGGETRSASPAGFSVGMASCVSECLQERASLSSPQHTGGLLAASRLRPSRRERRAARGAREAGDCRRRARGFESRTSSPSAYERNFDCKGKTTRVSGRVAGGRRMRGEERRPGRRSGFLFLCLREKASPQRRQAPLSISKSRCSSLRLLFFVLADAARRLGPLERSLSCARLRQHRLRSTRLDSDGKELGAVRPNKTKQSQHDECVREKEARRGVCVSASFSESASLELLEKL